MDNEKTLRTLTIAAIEQITTLTTLVRECNDKIGTLQKENLANFQEITNTLQLLQAGMKKNKRQLPTEKYRDYRAAIVSSFICNMYLLV